MIRFFRKIRKTLLIEGKFGRYLKYAFGEIVLVVIGILIALQVNNWNEDRKQKNQFLGLLEQIYNSINIDTEYNRYFYDNVNEQILLINQILEDPSKIPQNKLLHILFYLDLNLEEVKSNTDNLLQFLDYGYNDEKQSAIAKQLNAYDGYIAERIRKDQLIKQEEVAPILLKANIPRPILVFGLMAYQDFGFVDSKYFTEEDMKDAQRIIYTRQFKSALKSLCSKKESVLLDLTNAIEVGTNYIQLIKDYNPDVKLQFKNLGILGTALDYGWNKSVPMNLKNIDEGIWEIDLKLNDGYIKFRNRDNWSYNWGGKGFPEGNTLFHGKDIPVTAGRYHITLNLIAKHYKFEKLED